MNPLSFALVLGLTSLACFSADSPRRVEFAFASVQEGQQVLSRRDDFIKRLSPFDRAARLKTDQPVDEAAFLKHVADSVLPFSKAETNFVWTALSRLQPKLNQYAVQWPTPVLLVKTTGHEEGKAAYTRGNAIIFPTKKLNPDTPAQLERLLWHELFHILSRYNPPLKEALYKAIGFEKCPELKMPPSWVWITNPDAPVNDHWISLTANGKPIKALPVLLANPPRYDLAKGGEFFDYLTFKLLAVEPGDAANTLTFNTKKPRLFSPSEVEGYFEQIGNNTDYIIHPEEIVAENFALLMTDATAVKSPDVLKRIKETLDKYRRK